MGAALTNMTDSLKNHRIFHGFDDFPSYTDAALWTKLAADSGSSVAMVTSGATQAAGAIRLTTGATDNNEAAVTHTNKFFLFAANKPIIVRARINYSEAATNAANVAFGLFSAAQANTLVDDGAGPATSFSGALIYKIDGSTVWKAISSLGATQITSTSTGTAGGGTQELVIQCLPVSSTIVEISYFADLTGDGNLLPLYDAALSGIGNRAIKHQLTYTSAAAMALHLYVKAGSGTSQTLDADYLAWNALR